MLFYVSLLLFSIAVSAIVLWVFRSLFEPGKSSGNEYKVVRKNNVKKTYLGSVSKPWGWSAANH